MEERDISVEWGDNIFQNLPYTYAGTFYENTDPTDAWDTAKIEFTYIPDTTINDEYTITQDFTNSESKFASGEQNFTFNEGSGSNYDNLQSNDNNYASFNHTGVGHYNATFGFESDLDGSNPSGWTVGETGGTVNVIGELDGHNKIMEIYDTDGVNAVEIVQTFNDGVQTDGIIEFWIYSDDVTDPISIYVRDSSNNAIISLAIFTEKILYYYAVGYHDATGGGVVDDTWYHFKIVFDITPDTYDFYLNGVLLDADIPFRAIESTGLTNIRMITSGASNNYKYYIDAVDYSWDSDYIEGRNREDLDPLGHYPATYSFDDQAIWTSRTDIDFVDVDGTTGDCESWIISNKEGHEKVLELTDNSSSTRCYVRNVISQTLGTIELWLIGSNLSNRIDLVIGDGGTGDSVMLAIAGDSGYKLQYYDGTWNNIANLLDNVWYHLRIVFDTTDFDIYLNGILEGNSLSLRGTPTLYDRLDIYTHNGDNGYTYYIDAVGYSWDNYLIGDNINDNYYLGYENFESYNMTNDAEVELEANGWVVDKGSGYNNVSISGEFSSHKKILNLTDDTTSGYLQLTNVLSSSHTSGTIEWWMLTTDASKVIYLISAGNGGQGFYLGINSAQCGYYVDGVGWTYIDTVLNYVWYHHRIVFDCGTDTFNWYIDGTLQGSDLDFRNVNTDISEFRIQSYTGHAGYSFYLDSFSYSWEDTDTYFKGSYNQHCNVEALIDFTVDVPFEYYESFILQVSMNSRHYTNIHTNISWSFYNFTSSSWTEINDYSAITETLREFDDSDVSVGLTGLFDSSGNMKFRYYGYNCSAFYLEIDELTANVYFGTQFEYEHTLSLLGTWKYRFKLNMTLYNEHITDWIYINIVEQPPNFEGISESRYSTKWVLTSTSTSGELTEVYYDDMTTGYWDLSDYSSRTITATDTPTDDAWVDINQPDTNYGGDVNLYVYCEVSSAYENSYFQHDLVYNYILENISHARLYVYVVDPSTIGLTLYQMPVSFDEGTITYNNAPTSWDKSWTGHYFTTTGWKYFSMGTTGSPNDYTYMVKGAYSNRVEFRSKEYSGTVYDPYFSYQYYKNYHNTSGEGYSYFQTNVTETLGLISPKSSSNTSLSEGDVFTVDLQSTSDNALLKLYSGGVLQQTINLLTANTETSRQEVEVIVSEEVSFDQIKITSELDDTEYFKLYDIKAEHWVFESEEDQKIMYVEPYGQNDLILNLGNNSLKIYENDILRTDTYITMTYDLTTHIFESPIPETVFVSFYDSNNDYLNFNEFTTYVNYTLYEENFINQRLTSREFYVDEDSTIYFNVYDSFDVNIYSASRLAKTFIDITLSVYTLKIKNEALDDSSYTLTKGSVSKTGILFPDEIDEYKIASGSYTFSYIKGTDPEESIDFTLSGDKLLKINRSQMCFLSYTNQRGEYLNFNQFKTYWNGTLLYENVFYEDIGNNVSIEIKDHYDISVKNHSFIVSSGDNYVPVILTMYSLKVFNQQESFNWINITRDPNYYESGYSWSEWVAPTEIIEFTLFPGYYKINLTDNENSGSSYYSYTLNGDDILLISSGNIISNVIINIANINATIGNQITNVQIDLTNQNSQINNSIINVEINLGNINSTLGNMLVNIDLDITNIANNITSLYTFTNNSFINLDNNINNSFIYMENNIISINQSISNLVIGVSNDIYLINGTISTMITQMENNLLLMNVSINTALFDLDTTLSQIGSNITNNYILLNNSITLTNNNINDSRIAIINNLALINNTISNLISQVYSSVYMINNSIYTAVIDMGTSLSLINNSISGDLTIMLQQNDFLTELYQMTMFSSLLNFTNIGYNYSLLESQVDAWEFINNYRNDSISVILKYQDQIENLTVSAQNTLSQYLPSSDVEYRLWSIANEEYLNNWTTLPDNMTVGFGFYEEVVPDIPDFSAPNTVLMIVLILMACGSAIALVGYMAYRYRKRSENYRRSYADKVSLEAQTIKNFSQGRRIR